MLNINIELSMEQTEEELEDEWRTIDWIDVKRYVDRMQGKIFLATKNSVDYLYSISHFVILLYESGTGDSYSAAGSS